MRPQQIFWAILELTVATPLLLAILWPAVVVAATFQQPSTWTTPIPSNPTLVSNGSTYINHIANSSTDGNNSFSISNREWSVTQWQAVASDPMTTVNVTSTNCGANARANGWDKVPIPAAAVPPGEFDGHMTVMSADGRYEYDFYKAC